MRIYIAGPYDGDCEQNTINAILVMKALKSKGHTPFCPHLLHFAQNILDWTRDEYLMYDLEWLHACDALYFIAPSPGAEIERMFAMYQNMEIYKSLDEVPDEQDA